MQAQRSPIRSRIIWPCFAVRAETSSSRTRSMQERPILSATTFLSIEGHLFMSKKHTPSSVFRFCSIAALLLLVASTLTSCDRGATEQIQAAERFSEAVAKNNTTVRDSMIATDLFRKYFHNDYVASDFITWIQSMYDIKNHKFVRFAKADVDRDL